MYPFHSIPPFRTLRKEHTISTLSNTTLSIHVLNYNLEKVHFTKIFVTFLIFIQFCFISPYTIRKT